MDKGISEKFMLFEDLASSLPPTIFRNTQVWRLKITKDSFIWYGGYFLDIPHAMPHIMEKDKSLLELIKLLRIAVDKK